MSDKEFNIFTANKVIIYNPLLNSNSSEYSLEVAGSTKLDKTVIDNDLIINGQLQYSKSLKIQDIIIGKSVDAPENIITGSSIGKLAYQQEQMSNGLVTRKEQSGSINLLKARYKLNHPYNNNLYISLKSNESINGSIIKHNGKTPAIQHLIIVSSQDNIITTNKDHHFNSRDTIEFHPDTASLLGPNISKDIVYHIETIPEETTKFKIYIPNTEYDFIKKGDTIGSINFKAYDNHTDSEINNNIIRSSGSTHSNPNIDHYILSASISAESDLSPESTNQEGIVPGSLIFSTRSIMDYPDPNGGIPTERMAIDSNGYMTIGDIPRDSDNNLNLPKIALAIKSNTAILIPKGTTDERNRISSLEKGMIRYNTTDKRFEGYGDGDQWETLGGVTDIHGNANINSTNSTKITSTMNTISGTLNIISAPIDHMGESMNIIKSDINHIESYNHNLFKGPNHIEDITTINNKLILNGNSNNVALDINGQSILNDKLVVNDITTLNNSLIVNADTNITGSMSIMGNLIVRGTQTTVDTEHIVIQDPIMVLSSGQVEDYEYSGFIIEQESINKGIIWDKKNSRFATVFSENINGNTDITISGYADFKSKHQECSSIKVDDMLDILGSTKISGNVDFYGTVTMHGITVQETLNTGTSFSESIITDSTLNGTTSIFGDTIVTGDIFTNGNIDASTIYIDSHCNIKGTTTVSGETILNNTLSVADDTSLSADLSVSGNTTLSGTTTVSGTTVLNNTLSVDGNTSLGSNLLVSGNTVLFGTTTVSGTTILNNTLSVTDDTSLSADLSVSGNTALFGTTTVSGATVLKDTLSVADNTSLAADLFVSGNTTLSGTTIVSGSTVLKDTLLVADDTSLAADLSVSGNTALFGTTTVSGTTVLKDTLSVDGNTSLSADLSVSGNTSLFGTTTVSGATVLKDTLSVENDTLLESDLSVSGNTTLSGTTTVHDLNVDSDITILGNIIMSGKQNDSELHDSGIIFTGTTNKTFLWQNTSGGKFDSNQTINVYNGKTYQIHNTNVFEDKNTLGNSITKSSLTSVGVLEDISVKGIVNITGQTILKDTLSVSGDTLLESGLSVSGNTTLSGKTTVQYLNVNSDINVSGNTIISGDLFVGGTTTTINTTNLIIEDKDIVIANGNSIDNTLSGAGFKFKGSTEKTFLWWRGVDDIGKFESSENINLQNGKTYMIDNEKLFENNTTLGNNITNSSLRSVGVLGDTSISGIVNITGSTIIKDSLSVSGNTSLVSDLYVSGDTRLSGATTLSGPTTVSGETLLKDTLSVAGNTSLGANLLVSGNTTLSGTTTVSGNTSLVSDLSVSGDTRLSGSTTLSGPTDLKSTLSVAGDTSLSADMSVLGRLFVSSEPKTIGKTNITGTTIISGLYLPGENNDIFFDSGSGSLKGEIYLLGSWVETAETYAQTAISGVNNANTDISGLKTRLSTAENDISSNLSSITENLNTLQENLPDFSTFVTSAALPDVTPFKNESEINHLITAKIPDTSNFITSAALPDVSAFKNETQINALITAKIPDTSSFITSAALPDITPFKNETEINTLISAVTTPIATALALKANQSEMNTTHALATAAANATTNISYNATNQTTIIGAHGSHADYGNFALSVFGSGVASYSSSDMYIYDHTQQSGPTTYYLLGTGRLADEQIKITFYCNGAAWVFGGIITSSDRRIKTNIEDVPDKLALQQVLDIPCRYYNYKDILSKGTTKVIGFIAQEVAEILPEAVSKQKEVIPSVMKLTESQEWYKQENGEFLLKVPIIEDAIENTVVRLYLFENENSPYVSKDIPVYKIEDDHCFFLLDKEYEKVFVYGIQVDDFHTVKKEMIFALHHSAIQELDKIIKEEQTKTTTLETKVTILETKNQSLETKVSDLESKNLALEAEIAAIKSHIGL